MLFLITTVFLFLCALGQKSWVAAPKIKPALDQFRFNTVLSNNPDYVVTLYWNIINENTAAEELSVALRVKTDTSGWNYQWLAIGFGDSMLDAQFIVCHGMKDGGVAMHQHSTTKGYSAPTTDKKSIDPLQPIVGLWDEDEQICHFKRKTNPDDTFYKKINIQDNTNVLYAFNPTSVLNYRGAFFSKHPAGNVGSSLIQFSSGNALKGKVIYTRPKRIHGYGMMLIWLFLFPTGAFYARHFRSTPSWLFVKVSFQAIGIFGVFCLTALIFTNQTYLDDPHAYLGLSLLALIVIQTTFGIFTLMGLSNENLDKNRSKIRNIHRSIGFTIMLGSIPQLAMGINKLNPWVEPISKVPWVILFSLTFFWIFAFSLAEFVSFSKNRNLDSGRISLMVQKYEKVSSGENLKEFTWETLGDAIACGELYVVGNGRYVYDISKWITSHPGGQTILHSVSGTDITNDFFNEAGYDAAEFTPILNAPKPRADRISKFENFVDTGAQRSTSLMSTSTSASSEEKNLFTDKDWMLIQRARRTHIHSRSAIQRLSTLIVGVIKSRSKFDVHSSTETLSDGADFDAFEYRRYALTRMDDLKATDGQTFARFHFCLLYPYDSRSNEPESFMPGHHIEISCRIQGEIVTRKYTPTYGNMKAFDIIVKKSVNGGRMSDFLFDQNCGDRQFKIRGPFGVPLLPPMRQMSGYTPTGFSQLGQLFFFAAGSGITPFLQLVTHVLLPLNTPLQVVQNYEPIMDDELKVSIGDWVKVRYHYLDGWCFGYNLTTRRKGVFPLIATRAIVDTRLILLHFSPVNEPIAGRDLIKGAQLGYPYQIEIHSINFQNYNLNTIMDIYQKNERELSQRHVVCGPSSFKMVISDLLEDNSRLLSIDYKDITILE